MAVMQLQSVGRVAAGGIGCWAAGKGAQRIRLPQITGYLVAGIVAGPHGIGLITEDVVHALLPLESACLAAIALAAGAELQLAELQRTRRQVLCITGAIMAASWLAVAATVVAVSPAVSFLSHRPHREVMAVASLGGTLACARSPASAIAVLRETEGKGAFCSLVMAVVVLKDVMVFLAFAINLEAVSAVMPRGSSAGLMCFWGPAASLAMSGSLGVAAGAMLGLVLPAPLKSLRLPASVLLRVKGCGLFLVSVAVFSAAEVLSAEPLLACVTAGLVIANRRWDVGRADLADDQLAAAQGIIMPTVNPVFFGLVGCSVSVGALLKSAWVAALLAVIRGVAVWVGSLAGCLAGNTDPLLRPWLWQGMITQAGIAMGLAKTVAARFPAWGGDFSTLMIGAVLVNMMAGPLLFRGAIVALGENRRRHSKPHHQLDNLEPKYNIDSKGALQDIVIAVQPESPLRSTRGGNEGTPTRPASAVRESSGSLLSPNVTPRSGSRHVRPPLSRDGSGRWIGRESLSGGVDAEHRSMSGDGSRVYRAGSQDMRDLAAAAAAMASFREGANEPLQGHLKS